MDWFRSDNWLSKKVTESWSQRAREVISPDHARRSAAEPIISYRVEHLQADFDREWDALVETAAGGDLVQTTIWAASRRRLGIQSYRISAIAPGGVLAGGCIVYASRVAPGIWIGRIPRGPLLFRNSAILATSLIREIVAVSRHLGISILAVQPPEGLPAVEDALISVRFRRGAPSIAPEATVRIDLRRSDEELIDAMSSMRRRSLRKALASSFEVREDNDLRAFYRLHVATATRQGFVPITLENLQAQWDLLSPYAKCAMLIARHAEVPVAGIWLTRFANTITFKLAGWDATLKAAAHANDALHWATIRWAREQGAQTYDFGGFDRGNAERILTGQRVPDVFAKTPSFFKLGFGGRPVVLPETRFIFTHRLVNVAFGYSAERYLPVIRSRKFVQRLRSGGSPMPMCSRVENMFRMCISLIRPVHAYSRYLRSRMGDRKLGIITTDECVARELGRDHDVRYTGYQKRVAFYSAMPFTRVERIMRYLEPHSDDVMLDYGCGAGRVICVAARYPFSRVIGIDIDEKLCTLAEQNVRALRRAVVRPEIVCGDAQNYQVPDAVTIVFLYNPFGGKILGAALTRVIESMDRAPRRMRIVYANPREHDLIMSMDRFKQVDTMRFSWRPGKQWLRTQLVKFYDVSAQMKQ